MLVYKIKHKFLTFNVLLHIKTEPKVIWKYIFGREFLDRKMWQGSEHNIIKMSSYYYHITYPSCIQHIQPAKLLLLPPKCEIIMVPSNHSFFQYCDSNIGLFSIAPCKVITLNPLCILFGISSLLLFWWLSL